MREKVQGPNGANELFRGLIHTVSEVDITPRDIWSNINRNLGVVVRANFVNKST